MNPTLDSLLSIPNLKRFSKKPKVIKALLDPKTPVELRNQLLYLACFHDLELFVRIFLSHHCDCSFSAMHREFFEAEINPARRGRREVIAAPRGHAKTTFKALFKVIHAIVYHYEHFILIVGQSASEADNKVKNIVTELESNALLKEVYGNFIPSRGQPGWGTKDLVTTNQIRLTARSKGQSIRGIKFGSHRPTMIIVDDLETLEHSYQELQREKTKQYFLKDLMKLGSINGQTNYFVIGTCLHQEALLPELLASPGWQAKKYQAVISFPTSQKRWEEWRAIYTDLTNTNREADAHQFVLDHYDEMHDGVEVLWPENEPYERLMITRVNEGEASFQSEKQNDPYDPEKQIFNMERAKRFKMEYTSDGSFYGIRWQDGSDRFLYFEDLNSIVAFHDPALCVNGHSDYSAIVVCARDNHGYIYCLDAYIEKVSPSRQIQQALVLHQKWGFPILYLEENNFQGILKDNYDAAQEKRGTLRVLGVTHHNNKMKRIASMEPFITNGYILFNVDLNPRLISQMTLFPTGSDDGPDALHGAVANFMKKFKYLRT